MRFTYAATISCILLIPSLLAADVTLRYKMETKSNPTLPQAVIEAFSSVRSVAASSESVIRVKGGKSATTGLFNVIADLPNDKITILDPATRRFATVPASQYADEIARSMPQTPTALRGVLSAMKMTADSRLTGRTSEIHGIHTEEHEIVISIGTPSLPNAPAGPMIKIVMQVWMAKPEDLSGNPALREFVDSSVQRLGGMDPAESIQKLMNQIPGLADGLAPLMKQLAASHSLTMRMHVEVFMPILAILARQRASAADNPFAGVDPDAALMELNQELVETSTAPVADSFFVIPDGYTAVPLADIMSAMRSSKPPDH